MIYCFAQISRAALVISLSSLASLFIVIAVLAELEKESTVVNLQAIAQIRAGKLAAKEGK